MTTIEKTGIGYAVADYDCAYLRLDGEIVSAPCLARAAGAEVLDDKTVTAFDRKPLPSDPDDPFADRWNTRNAERRAEYADANVRACPRVYRFRITVEAEELSESEALAFWKATSQPASPPNGET